MVLDEHVTENHMTDLKQLTDDERRDFLQKYIKDESKMLYPDFHRQRFGGLQQGSTDRKVGRCDANDQWHGPRQIPGLQSNSSKKTLWN